MKCPRTNGNLKPVKVGGITVDVSENCGGVFFDNLELQSFDENHEIRGEVLVEHLSQFHNVLIDETKRINCPKCPDVVMMRRYYSPQQQIEIDECPNCGGIWLDSGELKLLRELFLTEEEREKFRDKMTAEVEEHPEVVAYRKEQEESVSKMENLTSILWRIIAPRY